jgi:hypothetical protein
MKKVKFKETGLFMVMILLLCAFFGVDSGVMAADVVSPAGGGAINVGAATTLEAAQTDSPNLTLDEIDNMVLMIKPYAAELNTLARKATVKTVAAPVYRHYTMDVMDLTTTVKTAYTAGTDVQIALATNNDDIFAVDETIIVKGVTGYEPGTSTATTEPLVLQVVGKDANGLPLVKPINGAGATNTIPAIAANTVLTRAGSAGSETQIKTDAFSNIPTDWEQYLQKHLCQVEQSEMFALSPKEVKWTFTDEAEAAAYDWKRKMNVTDWQGVKGLRKWATTSTGTKPEDRYFSRGVWYQAGKEYDFNGVAPGITNIPTFLRTALTGNNSSKEKFFIAGSGMIEAFEKSDYMTRYIAENGASNEKELWGLQFNGIKSKFGKLWVIHAESFDEMGWADQGFVLDFEYLIKVTYGLKTKDHNLRDLFISASQARVMEEQYALVLKNPKAHTRVYLNK